MSDHDATVLYRQLRLAWADPNSNPATVSDLLSQLKLKLAQLGLLFPTNLDSLDPNALATARDILEIGAIHSLRTSDVSAFERYLSLLQSYYQDAAVKSKLASSASTPAPPQRDAITALNLLRLLSQNRIAEFHTVLETLEKAILESTPVDWVLQLERSLMEGSYSKVWSLCQGGSSSSSSSKQSLPLAEFSHFTSTLLATVRSEIAACDEKAYETLPLVDAKTLLFFDSNDQVKEFAKSRNWYLSTSDNVLHFPSSPLHPSHLPKQQQPSSSSSNGVPRSMATGRTAADDNNDNDDEDEIGAELDRNKVVSATLLYAKELESIV